MRRVLAFAAASVATVIVLAFGIAAVFRGPGTVTAVALSGVIAVAVQLVAFAILRRTRHQPLVGWGLGSLLRMAVLAAYALIGVRGAGLDAAPALISLALFLFATMILEPILLEAPSQ